MSGPLRLDDPAVVGLPTREGGEPLIDVRTVAALRVGTRMAGSHPSFALLRATVVDRLVIAQSLLPRGLRLLVIEGYRPAAAQQRHFDACRDELRRSHPQWSDERVCRETGRYCAPAGSAPHQTGAAADLTLCTATGAELAMGSRVHAAVTEDGGARATAADVGAEALAHRGILAAALRAAGLVNLPTAWWHWSYGDRYWCHLTGAAAAPYGPIDA